MGKKGSRAECSVFPQIFAFSPVVGSVEKLTSRGTLSSPFASPLDSSFTVRSWYELSYPTQRKSPFLAANEPRDLSPGPTRWRTWVRRSRKRDGWMDLSLLLYFFTAGWFARDTGSHRPLLFLFFFFCMVNPLLGFSISTWKSLWLYFGNTLARCIIVNEVTMTV